MQRDHEADDLHALLQDEYGAPRLDDRFSAALIARLQTEATPSLSPTTATRLRWWPLAICLGVAAVAASVLAVLWISNSGLPRTNGEVARQAATDYDRSARQDLSSQLKREDDLSDHLSASPRTLSSSAENESLSASSARERKYHSEYRTHLRETLATKESQPRALSLLTTLEAEWPNTTAMVAHAERLYVVDSGHIYEVSPTHGSRRMVGDDDWSNTAAMGAAGRFLYIVCDNQLYEVNPTTGARRRLGEPVWAKTKAIESVGDNLYIVDNGRLHRVNPHDGSHEVVRYEHESPNNFRQPKP